MTLSFYTRVGVCIFTGLINFTMALSQVDGHDVYTVTFNSQNPKLVEVSATISAEDSLLKMSSFGSMPERWSNYVDQLSVTTASGVPVEVHMNDSKQWVLTEFEAGEPLRLRYRLNVAHDEVSWPGGIDGVAFVRPWGVMLSGRSLFVMNGASKKNIEVRFELPESWKISVPWKAHVDIENSYLVKNQTQLQESLLFAGTHEEIVIPKGDFNLKFVLGGDSILGYKQQYIDHAKKILDYYINLMGGNPIPGPGEELSTAMVMLNQSDQIDGEVIGNDISIFINPEEDLQSQTIGWFIFAHEFFHLWNGKTLRYSDTTTDWFKEGVTNYYTLKALNQVGVVNEEVTKMILNNLFYQRYVNDPGYGTLAPADAASGFDKDNHWGLVYGGGLFAGVCLDMEIRKNSEDGNSMDDVMRTLYLEFGGQPKTIDQTKLLDTFNGIGKTDFTRFIAAYIQGNESVPLHEYLKYAGVNVTYDDGKLDLQHISEKTVLQKERWKGFLGEN